MNFGRKNEPIASIIVAVVGVEAVMATPAAEAVASARVAAFVAEERKFL
jgi:hypothetical protein